MGTQRNLIAAAGLIVLLLTGCGTADESESKNVNGSGKAVAEQTEKVEKPKENNDQTTDTNEQKTENKDDVVRILEQNLSYEVNGEKKENTAFLKNNDNQNYSMYVLPEYELTAEEPNKDILFLTADDSIFMRIEILPDESNWTTVKDTTKAQLTAVSSEVKEIKVPTDKFFTQATALEATHNGETVTAYLINNQDLKLKLTMFTKEESDHRSAFAEMAKTIIQNK